MSTQCKHGFFINLAYNVDVMKTKIGLLTAVLFVGLLPVQSQRLSEEFTVATLNVDGLPTDVIGIPINSDGPGERYTPEIADYLLQKGYDIIGLQENFNYYDLLFPKMEADYQHDDCKGKMSLSTLSFPFPFDGISLLWRNNILGAHTGGDAWTEAYGIFDHANDALTKKGYRRYELTLAGGSQVVVYNGHWDASVDDDEENGRDTPDREARMSQWIQLRDAIMDRLDDRPVIVLGDTNSYYCTDNVKHFFIDYIEATGKARVSDARIEMECGGQFPPLEEGAATHDEGGHGWICQGEMLDKIIFINPTGGSKLTPLSYHVDSVAYMRSDDPTSPLGDHFPVSVKFRIEPAGSDETEIENPVISPLENREEWYDMQGQRYARKPTAPGIYLHHGRKIVIK